jgi:hypothetical protein
VPILTDGVVTDGGVDGNLSLGTAWNPIRVSSISVEGRWPRDVEGKGGRQSVDPEPPIAACGSPFAI